MNISTNVVNVIAYGFTQHQVCLLRPMLRICWNIREVLVTNEYSALDMNINNCQIVLLNANLPFYELDYCLKQLDNFVHLKKICINMFQVSSAVLQYLMQANVDAIIYELKSEEELNVFKDAVQKNKKFYSSNVFSVLHSKKDIKNDLLSLYKKLSLKEQKVFNLLLKCLSYKAIASELNISCSTVGTFCSRIFSKLGVSCVRELQSKFSCNLEFNL